MTSKKSSSTPEIHANHPSSAQPQEVQDKSDSAAKSARRTYHLQDLSEDILLGIWKRLDSPASLVKVSHYFKGESPTQNHRQRYRFVSLYDHNFLNSCDLHHFPLSLSLLHPPLQTWEEMHTFNLNGFYGSLENGKPSTKPLSTVGSSQLNF